MAAQKQIVEPVSEIGSNDPMNALLMELRYTNYLLLTIIQGRGAEFETATDFYAAYGPADLLGQQYGINKGKSNAPALAIATSN